MTKPLNWNNRDHSADNPNPFDPAIAETAAFDSVIDQLKAESRDSGPTVPFKQQLRNNLMTTHALSADHVLGAPENKSIVRRIGQSLPHGLTGAKWLAMAATIALVVATVILASQVFRSNEPVPSPSSLAAAPGPSGTPGANASPVANGCSDVPAYVPLCVSNPRLGSGLILKSELPESAMNVQQVEMQGWELPAGGTVNFEEPTENLTGVAVDFVVLGAYTVTFSENVVVSRPTAGWTATGITYVDANTPIELVRGDAVTYPIGAAHEITNPLSEVTVKWKTALVYDGDPSPENRAFSGDATWRIDGSGALPKTITDDSHLQLTYLPDTGQAMDLENVSQYGGISRVLGPVASTLMGGGPGGGFVLWYSESPGG